MKQKHVALLAASVLVIMSVQGCAVNKQLTPTGGSRADGTVKLSFEHSALEVPTFDVQQGMNAALQRCAAWGYTGAELFGGSTKTCSSVSGSGCKLWLVTVEYQCTGTPTASK